MMIDPLNGDPEVNFSSSINLYVNGMYWQVLPEENTVNRSETKL